MNSIQLSFWKKYWICICTIYSYFPKRRSVCSFNCSGAFSSCRSNAQKIFFLKELSWLDVQYSFLCLPCCWFCFLRNKKYFWLTVPVYFSIEDFQYFQTTSANEAWEAWKQLCDVTVCHAIVTFDVLYMWRAPSLNAFEVWRISTRLEPLLTASNSN